MKLRILKAEIKTPAANNWDWVIPASDADGNIHRFPVFDADLGRWIHEALGRYPNRSYEDTLKDILDNWEELEPKLTTELNRIVVIKK